MSMKIEPKPVAPLPATSEEVVMVMAVDYARARPATPPGRYRRARRGCARPAAPGRAGPLEALGAHTHLLAISSGQRPRPGPLLDPHLRPSVAPSIDPWGVLSIEAEARSVVQLLVIRYMSYEIQKNVMHDTISRHAWDSSLDRRHGGERKPECILGGVHFCERDDVGSAPCGGRHCRTLRSWVKTLKPYGIQKGNPFVTKIEGPSGILCM